MMKISPEAMKHLIKQPWYGNVRELQHTIEKAVIMSDSTTLTSNDFFLKPGSSGLPVDQNKFNLVENEKRIIEKALEKFKGNISVTAKELGINRTTLYDKMKKYGL
jgi:DNA-binding NtrC family response regulator